MKFLADRDVYATTIRYLSGLGHDVSVKSWKTSAVKWMSICLRFHLLGQG
jgi:hypothetical protein